MTLEVKKLGHNDLNLLIELISLYEDVFEMQNFVMPGDKYLETLLSSPGLTFLVAIIDRVVVGGLTAHNLPSTYFEASEVYVYDLAIDRKFQRQGIGTKLLAGLKLICRENGAKEFFLQADLDDTGAIDFYRATGGVPESVIHFSYDTSKNT